MLPHDTYKEYFYKALIFIILYRIAFRIDIKISVDDHILSNPIAFIAICSRILQLVYIYKILKHNYYALQELKDNDNLTEIEVIYKAFYLISTVIWADHVIHGGYGYFFFRINLFRTDYF